MSHQNGLEIFDEFRNMTVSVTIKTVPAGAVLAHTLYDRSQIFLDLAKEIFQLCRSEKRMQIGIVNRNQLLPGQYIIDQSMHDPQAIILRQQFEAEKALREGERATDPGSRKISNYALEQFRIGR